MADKVSRKLQPFDIIWTVNFLISWKDKFLKWLENDVYWLLHSHVLKGLTSY